MDVIWNVICQTSLLDKNTNNFSLINIIEELKISVPPPEEPLITAGQNRGFPVNLQEVILWSRSDIETPEKGQARFRIILPDGNSLMGKEIEIDLTQFLRFRTVTTIPILPLRGKGIYKFAAEYKQNNEWALKSAVPLRVILEAE